MIESILSFVKTKKLASSGIALGALLVVYFIFSLFGNGVAKTSYVVTAVERGTIISSLTGSGQVSSSNQTDIKPKASGDVTYVAVKNGQEVRAGALLVQLDASDAQKAVRNAEIDLENAQISLAKLKVNQQSDLPKLEDSIASAKNNLEQAYQNGFNEVANTFLDLPDTLAGIRDILYDSTVGTSGQSNSGAYQDLMDQYNRMALSIMITQADNGYRASDQSYNSSLTDYKAATRQSSPDQISALIDKTLETVKIMAQSVKDEQNILDEVVASLRQYQSSRPIPQAIIGYQSDISGYISKLNGHIISLTNTKTSITSNLQSLASSQRSLDSTKQFNPLDIKSQENVVAQRKASLQDARDALSNTYVRASFAGVITNLSVKRGDSVSTGTAVATLVSKQPIAEISLNEVDVAQIKAGQKATITFDAIEDLTITGQVLEVDTLGTVSQGVVSYGAKIGFDTQDERVKPGMSASASIITAAKPDVLIVPNAAIKSSNSGSYVEVPSDTELAKSLLSSATANTGIALSSGLEQKTIQVGLTSDTETEVTGGLEEGDLIIVRSVAASSAANTTQTGTGQNIFQGGSGVRIPIR